MEKKDVACAICFEPISREACNLDQQEAFAAAFRGMWTSEGNSQVLIPVRELGLCDAPHNASNAEGVFMQSAAA